MKKSEPSYATPPVLFLSNNDNTTALREALVKRGESLLVLSKPLMLEDIAQLKPAFVLSFNYKHIVAPEVIEALERRIVNVHCSMLPYNRGASPNFFSWYCNTSKGVTIHQMDERLDKGGILIQEEICLSEDETFRSSYGKLIDLAGRLVLANWDQLSQGGLRPRQPRGRGSYHSVAEFEAIRERYPFEWDDVIGAWKETYGLI